MDVGKAREQERKLEGAIKQGVSFLPLTLTLSRKGRGDFNDTRFRGNDERVGILIKLVTL